MDEEKEANREQDQIKLPAHLIHRGKGDVPLGELKVERADHNNGEQESGELDVKSKGHAQAAK
jgi:hypothetical protein